jgi:uncharacterized protein (TIGR02452 family)
MNIYYDRIKTFKDTVEYTEKYFNTCEKSIKHSNISNINYEKCNTFEETDITVLNEDTIDVYLKYINYSPVLLNLADPSIPGGCVNTGASAQEENIFRRTNYYKTLEMKFYPLLNNELVYSPSVKLFKTSEETGYKLIKKPVNISIIACPSVRHPELISDFSDFKHRSDKLLQYRKICMIFKTAIIHNHNVIILSALGCGAFKCPSEIVAKLFKKAINKYKKYFKSIVFAIKQPVDNLSKNNYEIFKKILCTL